LHIAGNLVGHPAALRRTMLAKRCREPMITAVLNMLGKAGELDVADERGHASRLSHDAVGRARRYAIASQCRDKKGRNPPRGAGQ
jgi:hypothetical protein